MTDFVSHLDVPDEAKAMLIVAAVEAMQQRKCLPWTDRDIEILHTHYPSGGTAKCATLLPQRTRDAIGLKARNLGLSRPVFKRRVSQFSTTPYIDAAITRYYQSGARRGGLTSLAHQVGRPVGWVSSRAQAIGVVVPRFAAAKWCDEEIALLRQHAAKIPQTIARVMRRHGFTRTAESIKLKLMRLRCDRNDDDIYTAAGLAEIFGVDKMVVGSWIKKGWLKARTRGSGHPNDSYEVHHNNVRRFVIENVGAIDVRRVDKYWLVDLLAGNS